MLKARTKGEPGKGPKYIVGLSARNLELLRKGSPIRFDSAEIKLPKPLWIVIAMILKPEHAAKLRKHYATDGKQAFVFGLMPAALDQLQESGGIIYSREKTHFDGDFYLLYGETEKELAKDVLDIETEEVKPGYRDELDPVTGLIIRRPVTPKN